VRAVELGWPQREIAASAYRTQRQVDSGERPIVGVNRHVEAETASIPTLKIDRTPEDMQVAHVQAVRAARDAGRARAGLDRVRQACAGDANVMEAVVEAARGDATLGEICRVFRDVFGEYRDPAEI
jgi:methylmalonyl-CoA mutase N-terminal domain/subunit